MAWDIAELTNLHDGMTAGYVYVCHTDDVAFGPIMASAGEAEDFADAIGGDPRRFSGEELKKKYFAWRLTREEYA